MTRASTGSVDQDWQCRLLELLERDIANNRLILPSLPEVSIKVRELLCRDDSGPKELARVISRDAAITARLLKVANSSSLRGSKPVTVLSEAISRLGMNLVRSLVTQLAILQAMQTGKDSQRLRGFVASSMHISTICHALTQSLPHLDPEEAATAGLLHDIGKLPLRQFLARQPKLADNEKLRSYIELKLHPQVGQMLLEQWRFPPELVQVAREHEDLLRDTAPEADYVDVVIAANLRHYGTEKGRYSQFRDRELPAVLKVESQGDQQAFEAALEKRMEFSNAMVTS